MHGERTASNIVTPMPQGKRKRVSPRPDPKDVQIQLLQLRLDSALNKIQGLKATVKLKDDELIEVCIEMGKLQKENAEPKAKVAAL